MAGKETAEDLQTLREKLGEIDLRIIELAAKRQLLVSEIGKIKKTIGKATRDFGQERVVVMRARRKAEDLGLPASLGEELVATLIQHSLQIQEQARIHGEGEGAGSRALIVGGAGQMGQWFLRFLLSQGFKVEIADPVAAVEGVVSHKDWRDIELQHDLIVLATPLLKTNRILLDLAASPPRGTVFDIGSLKSPIREGLTALRAAGGRVTSIHPMFGPNTDLLSGRHVVFIHMGVPEATKDAKALFAPTMAKCIDLELESHDRLIAYVLGASHALNLAFISTLADSGETAHALANLSSTTFNAQTHVARQVVEENPSLYYEIQALNDYGTESLSALLLSVERLRSVVRARDRGGFTRLMERCRDYAQTLPNGESAKGKVR